MVKKLLQNQYRLIKIDELTIERHYHLSADDNCYYLMEYKKEDGFDNQEKQLIINFKKKLSTRHTNQWQYKVQAIAKLAALFHNSIVPQIFIDNVTLVPIPPSKCKTDAEYDDRMHQLLVKSFPGNADIRELLVNIENIRSAHDNPDNRPTPQELQANMAIDPALAANIRGTVILFDDVLTSGGHFLACKNTIKQAFPNVDVIGIFISRTFWAQPDPFEFDDFMDEDWLDF